MTGSRTCASWRWRRASAPRRARGVWRCLPGAGSTGTRDSAVSSIQACRWVSSVMFIHFISNQLQLSLFCHRTEYFTRYVTQRRVVTQPYSDCCQGYHMMHTICCRKLCDYVSNQGKETDSKRTSHCSSLNVNVFLSASCNFCNGYCIAPNTCLETLWRHDTYLETLWRCHVHRSRDTLKSICMLWNRHIAEIFSERFITFPLKLFEGLHFFSQILTKWSMM